MASKTYVDLQGPAVDAAWLNDTNNAVYNVLGDGTLAPTTALDARTNLGLTASTPTSGASLVGYKPTGTIAANTVQGAIDEVVSDLAASGGAATVGFNPTGTITATNVQNAIVQAASASNYFVTVEQYGAVGDGVTNDSAAFQAAIDAVYTAGGGTVWFSKKYLIDSTITVKDFVSLRGLVDLPGATMPYSSGTFGNKYSTLIVNSAATISVNSGASVSHATVIRKGLTLPFANATAATAGVAAFAGTAITCSAYNAEDAYIHHLFILGFDKAVYSSNNNRTRVEYVQGDCTNGIELDVEYDVAYVSYCHFWPFTTSQNAWITNALLTRSGVAYRFASVGDWSRFTNCFSFGYAVGYSVSSCNEVNFVNCSADHVGAIAGNTSVGFAVVGTSINTTFIGCHAAAQGTGIQVSISGAVSNNVKIEGCSFWANDYAAIDIQAGRGVITGNTFFQNNIALLSASSDGHVIIGNDFDQETTPYSFASGCLRQCNILGNRFNATTESTGHNIVKDGAAVRFTGTSANTALSGLLLTGRASQGTLNSPSIGAANQSALTGIGLIHDGTDYQTAGYMRIQNDAAIGSGSTPGKWVFSTTPSSSTTAIDRTVVTKDGHLTPVTDNVYTCGASGVRWSAVWAANGTIQTSDQRTKTQITDATLGLDFINKLRPVSYKFIVGGNKVLRQVYRDEQGNEVPSNAENAIPAEIITEEVPGERTHWGLISQEVKAVMDESGVDFGGWVLSDKSDPNSQQALRYDEFIAPLIKAVQELSAEVTVLKSKLP